MSNEFYHIAITMRDSQYPILGLDLSLNDIEAAIGHLRAKNEFDLSGRRIFPCSVTRLQIVKSDVDAVHSFVEVDQESNEVIDFEYEPFPHQYKTLRELDFTAQFDFTIDSPPRIRVE